VTIWISVFAKRANGSIAVFSACMEIFNEFLRVFPERGDLLFFECAGRLVAACALFFREGRAGADVLFQLGGDAGAESKLLVLQSELEGDDFLVLREAHIGFQKILFESLRWVRHCQEVADDSRPRFFGGFFLRRRFHTLHDPPG